MHQSSEEDIIVQYKTRSVRIKGSPEGLYYKGCLLPAAWSQLWSCHTTTVVLPHHNSSCAAATPLLCCCNTTVVLLQHQNLAQNSKKSKRSPNGSPWLRLGWKSVQMNPNSIINPNIKDLDPNKKIKKYFEGVCLLNYRHPGFRREWNLGSELPAVAHFRWIRWIRQIRRPSRSGSKT